MGTHGRGGISHFLLGSTTEKLIRKSALPVLVVPLRHADAGAKPGRRRVDSDAGKKPLEEARSEEP